jgi:hypothetical protein
MLKAQVIDRDKLSHESLWEGHGFSRAAQSQ